MTPASPRYWTMPHRANPYASNEIRKTMNPPRTSFLSPASGIDVLANDLVNTLTAQLVLLSQIAERKAGAVVAADVGISRVIRGGARAQRAPLPTRDSLEFLDAVLRQFVCLATLADVADKGTEFDVGAGHVLDVQSRDSAMAFAFAELLEGGQVHEETHVVVHACKISATPAPLLADEQNFNWVGYGGGKAANG